MRSHHEKTMMSFAQNIMMSLTAEGSELPEQCKNLHHCNGCMLLQIISNGVYRSIEHRATANSEQERLSIAAFHSPRLTAEIGPVPSLISPEKESRGREVLRRSLCSETARQGIP